MKENVDITDITVTEKMLTECTTPRTRYQQYRDDCKKAERYENLPMQYTEIFKVVKNGNFQKKIFDIFLIFAQNIDCGHSLEPPRRSGSNEYPQSMLWSKNKKNRYTPA